MENDLVEVTAHSGARPDHAKWQGGIYSLYGRSKKFERERIAEDINKNSRKSIENTDKSSTIKPTKVISGHSGTPKKAEPNAVIDHTDKNGKVDARGFYGDDGLKNKVDRELNKNERKENSDIL